MLAWQLCDFQGIQTSIVKEPYIFVKFKGGPDPLYPLWIRTRRFTCIFRGVVDCYVIITGNIAADRIALFHSTKICVSEWTFNVLKPINHSFKYDCLRQCYTEPSGELDCIPNEAFNFYRIKQK